MTGELEEFLPLHDPVQLVTTFVCFETINGGVLVLTQEDKLAEERRKVDFGGPQRRHTSSSEGEDIALLGVRDEPLKDIRLVCHIFCLVPLDKRDDVSENRGVLIFFDLQHPKLVGLAVVLEQRVCMVNPVDLRASCQ